MTPPTSPQALARALRERLDRTRVFIQDTMDTQHVPRGAIGNLMSARDEVDATVANLTALVTWALEMEARNAELEKALTDARTWHEAEDEALSKQPPSHGPNGNQWTRLQHREQIDLLTAAIAGKQS